MKKLLYTFILWIITALPLWCSRLDGFTLPPYLLEVTDTGATVAFQLEQADTASVIIHPGGTEYVSGDSKKKRLHFIRITDLEPGKAYRYAVITGDTRVRTPENDTSWEIRTAGRPGESFTFVVYGDPRPGETRSDYIHREIIDQISRTDPVFCLVLGDMVDDGTDRSLWEEFLSLENKILRRSGIFPVFGDNDYAAGKGLVKEYFPILENNYYSFTWSGLYFFGLSTWDTKGRQPRPEFDAESDQLQWFISQVSRQEVREAPFRIVFMHDPVLISRGRSSDILRRIWEPVFREYNIDVVFASWHLYERSQYNGVRYIISGGAGAELIWMNPDKSYVSQVDARKHHFCQVDVNAGSMTIRAVERDGTILDSFTLTPRSSRTSDIGQFARLAQRLARKIEITNGPGMPRLSIHLFSYDCAYCRRLLNKELPALSQEAGISLTINYYDLGTDPRVYDLFMAAGTDFGRQDADIPALFTGRSVLGGEDEIREHLPQEFTRFKTDPQGYREKSIFPFQAIHDTKTMKQDSFFSLTTGMVIGAGLVDGINPCAFTTIIFLISYLTLVGKKRKDILLTGGIFTAAVFLTYLAIGSMFYQGAHLLTGDLLIGKIINSILLGVVILFAIISIADFIKCLQGKETEMTLQLPGFLKKKIQTRIRKFARGTGTAGIVAFILGVVIAGMELACTGQVYIPIVAMISDPVYRTRAAGLLLLYNLGFILPLMIVFLLASFGVTSDYLGRVFRKHIAFAKLGLTLVFMAMAGVLLYNLNII